MAFRCNLVQQAGLSDEARMRGKQEKILMCFKDSSPETCICCNYSYASYCFQGSYFLHAAADRKILLKSGRMLDSTTRHFERGVGRGDLFI